MKERAYGTVPCINFDRRGYGPISGELAVRANIDPNLNYPETRIYVGAWGESSGEMDFGGMCLTVGDARKLVEMLKEAIADVVKHAPALLVEDLT